MLGARAETDEREIGSHPCSQRSNTAHIGLVGDDLMPHPRDDRLQQRKMIFSLVRDQDSKLMPWIQFKPPRRPVPRTLSRWPGPD